MPDGTDRRSSVGSPVLAVLHVDGSGVTGRRLRVRLLQIPVLCSSFDFVRIGYPDLDLARGLDFFLWPWGYCLKVEPPHVRGFPTLISPSNSGYLQFAAISAAPPIFMSNENLLVNKGSTKGPIIQVANMCYERRIDCKLRV